MNIRLKSDRSLCSLVFLLASLSAHGQGTFEYDQQSADENTGGGVTTPIQSNQLIGQSFTPINSAVGFIRLYIGDTAFNSLGATLYVNLRTNSINGPVLASTAPVFMPDGFVGYTNFFFSLPVAITPGTIYYFQPVVQSGDVWAIVGYNYGYAGGTAYFQGVASPTTDLWFREGVIPEPSSLAVVAVGAGLLAVIRRFRRRV